MPDIEAFLCDKQKAPVGKKLLDGWQCLTASDQNTIYSECVDGYGFNHSVRFAKYDFASDSFKYKDGESVAYLDGQNMLCYGVEDLKNIQLFCKRKQRK